MFRSTGCSIAQSQTLQLLAVGASTLQVKGMEERSCLGQKSGSFRSAAKHKVFRSAS